jgi:antitoxin MazE
MKVAKWGNSLAVRIPVEVAQSLGLQEGDDIELTAAEPKTLGVWRKPTLEELLDEVAKLRGAMPKDLRFDREEANER